MINQSQIPQTQIIQTPFGIMVPGQLAITQFEQLGPYLTYSLLNPGSIHSVGFFLFQAIDLNMAACLYFSVPPYQGLEFIGAVANARPSDIFPTNFALNPNVNSLQELKLIVQLQPMDEKLQSLVTLSKQGENQVKYAMAIAQNLYNFMCSFNQEIVVNGNQQEMIVTPTNVLDKWIKRFQEKYIIDPNFIYKTTQ